MEEKQEGPAPGTTRDGRPPAVELPGRSPLYVLAGELWPDDARAAVSFTDDTPNIPGQLRAFLWARPDPGYPGHDWLNMVLEALDAWTARLGWLTVLLDDGHLRLAGLVVSAWLLKNGQGLTSAADAVARAQSLHVAAELDREMFDGLASWWRGNSPAATTPAFLAGLQFAPTVQPPPLPVVPLTQAHIERGHALAAQRQAPAPPAAATHMLAPTPPQGLAVPAEQPKAPPAPAVLPAPPEGQRLPTEADRPSPPEGEK